VDVTGYYSSLDATSTGTNEFDILGNTAGDVMEINNAGTGTAFVASSGAAGGTAARLTAASDADAALYISSGHIRISGATTVGSTTNPAFIHRTTAGNTCPNTAFTVVKHSLLNNQPNTMLMITPRVNDVNNDVLHTNGPIQARYLTGTTCGGDATGVGSWFIYNPGSANAVGTAYNVLIIKP
jgi:hypothetical protein